MKRTIKEQDEGLKAYPLKIDAEHLKIIFWTFILGGSIGIYLAIQIKEIL